MFFNWIKEKIYGPKIIFIIGPTASGKTSFSIELAKRLDNEAAGKGTLGGRLRRTCEIISADSRQIYHDFNLLSGKVTEQEMQNIPHHLLNVVKPGEYFSVEDFSKTANKIIREIIERKHTPIIVGGTGFYIDTILYKYNLPNVSPDFEFRKKYESKSMKEIFAELKTLDPDYAEREFLNKDNRHRMTRALEIARKIGKIPPLKKELRYKNIEIVYINPDKENLFNKIDLRLKERLDQGMTKELSVVKEKYNLNYNYLESLGLEFRYISLYLQNKISEEEMISQLSEAIKKYTKRQRTWFNRYLKLPFTKVIK